MTGSQPGHWQKHVPVFRANVDLLVRLAQDHPEDEVRLAAKNAICTFALLTTECDAPDVLRGADVIDIIEKAVVAVADTESAAVH